jgi:hypothetical protein
VWSAVSATDAMIAASDGKDNPTTSYDVFPLAAVAWNRESWILGGSICPSDIQ